MMPYCTLLCRAVPHCTIPPCALPCYAVLCCAGEKRQEIVTQRGQQAVLLSDHDRDRLEDMLRGLTAERAAIAEVGPCAGRGCSEEAQKLWGCLQLPALLWLGVV
jgi:hypothetical protein